MVQQKNKIYFGNILKYVLFLFAFVCAGFINSRSRVAAADSGPVIIIPNDYNYKDGDLKVYIGYNENNFNYIKYWFNDSSDTTNIDINSYSSSYSNNLTKENICSTYNKGASCPLMLREYTIPKDQILKSVKANNNFDGTNTGIVTLYIEADNKKTFIFIPAGGGRSQENEKLNVFVDPPKVESINISVGNNVSSNTPIIGDKINFTINFDKQIFNKDTVLKFKIGESSKIASCTDNLSNFQTFITCSYVVENGDMGQISMDGLVSSSKVKDRYNNVIVGTLQLGSTTINGNYVVDGVLPEIVRLEVVKGIYSVSNPLLIKVVFNEKIKITRIGAAPEIVIDDYATCSYNSSSDEAIVYSCLVKSIEKNGYVTKAVVKYETSYIYDMSGNMLEPITNKEFNLTVVDNNGNVLSDTGVHINSKDPDLNFENISYVINRRGMTIDTKYVKKDDDISITIPVKAGVEISSGDTSAIKVMFGDVRANPAISFVDSKLLIEIRILDTYNGKLSINFDNFSIVGQNGQTKTVNYAIDLDVYSDNKAPVISNIDVVVNNGKLIDGTIYGGSSTNVIFNVKIDDISSVSLDASKIVLKTSNSIIYIDKDNISLNENTLTINVLNSVLSGLSGFYLVIEKGAIKDIFDETFVSDYSEYYVYNKDIPNIDMSFDYPMYKGISIGDRNYLVSGNEIRIELYSNDADLKSYCISNMVGECNDWLQIEENKKFTYSLPTNLQNGTYNIYLCVMDYANNSTCTSKSLEVNNAFEYNSGTDVKKNHSVTVNAFMFEKETKFYYKWIKQGENVSNFTSTIMNNSYAILINGDINLNGKYMLCINQDDKTVCSDYLEFDNDIDEFDVKFIINDVIENSSSTYTSGNIGTLISFNDISTIKCVAVGKNVSNISCDRNNENVTYYDGSDFGSPIRSYVIKENGEYTFYIEDIIGNTKKLKYVIENIDREAIDINIYSENNDDNLEENVYKKAHRFNVLFDEGKTNGSNHMQYSYFFTTKNYSVDSSNPNSVFYSEDTFNNYFYSDSTKVRKSISDSATLNARKLLITSPSLTGVYNLYIKAVDSAGNVSYAYVSGIMVDGDAPSIVMKDDQGEITNGDSSTYITNFNYQVEISDLLTNINKDEVYYEFVEYNSKTVVMSVKYTECDLAKKTCTITKVKLDSTKFDSTNAYQFIVRAKDSAGNEATYSSNKLFIKIPTVVINSDVDATKVTNSRNVSFTVSGDGNEIERVAYCLNDCYYTNKTLSSGFVNLNVNSSNIYSLQNLLFKEGTNVLYLYAIDIYGNDKLETYTVKFDSIEPLVETNNVQLVTNNSSNLYVTLEDGKRVYNYANENQIKLKFGVGSLLDSSNQINDNMKVYVCFGETCNYYDVSGYYKDGYYVNRELIVSSPIRFTGTISYYVVDNALNNSSTYELYVRYSVEVEQVAASVYDVNNAEISESKKYNKFILNISNEATNYLIEKQYIEFALVPSSIDLLQEKENYSGLVRNFLNYYGFTSLTSNNQIISRSNVDSSYYLWIYVRNEICNYSIFKVNKLLNIDTINPSFEDIILDVRKNSDDSYSLVLNGDLGDNKLYISTGGEYSEVNFENNVYTFNKNSSTIFSLKLVDSASNETINNYEYSSIMSNVYARAYFNAKSKKVVVVVNNLGSKKVTNFMYIMDDVNSTVSYDDIDSVISCSTGITTEACKSNSYTSSNNVYTISVNEDKRIILYIYVDNVLLEELVEVIARFDDEAPEVYYTLKNSNGSYGTNYTKINGDIVYVSGSIKVRMYDNKKISHFEVYDFEDSNLLAKCYYDDASSDYNCNRDVLEKNGNNLMYNLETGNYVLRVYDESMNMKEVKIITDTITPVIKLYKKINDNYYYQAVIADIYGSLEGLYISVDEENFSIMNVIASKNASSYFDYGYTSSIGKCLVNRDVCQYGVSLLELINNSSSEYDRIYIKVVDKANKTAEITIRYDDSIPNIYIDDTDGSIISIGNTNYTIVNNAINVEIGNDNIDIGALLKAMRLNISGMGYDELKNLSSFKVEAYKNNNLFSSNIFESIGSYVIKINYSTVAGNKAEEKIINVNVVDTKAPDLYIINETGNAELNSKTEILGVRAIDNYAMEINANGYVKEKVFGLDEAVCIGTICDNVVKVDSNIYKFTKSGIYKFRYTIRDYSNNEAIIEQTIIVSDNKAPTITGAYGDEVEFKTFVENRDDANQVVIPTVRLQYPSSFDEGDAKFVTTSFVGVYVSNNIGTKAKSQELHVVSDDGNIVELKFTKVGTYYIRFTSIDSTNHMATFEYIVQVIDNTNPEIVGISEGQIIEIDLNSNFDVKYDILDKYGVFAKDNYYSNVNITYQVEEDDTYDYKVTLFAKDLSSNETSVTVYVKFIDRVKPTVGDLVLPESTNSTSISFDIIGGDDNSDNWWHEYSVQDGEWVKYDENSRLVFGEGLNAISVRICIRAVDAFQNISENKSCKNIIVDTSIPEINGIENNLVVSGEVEITVSDNSLDTVRVWFDDQLLEITKEDFPRKFNENGTYRIEAVDTYGNKAVKDFVINGSTHVDIVNDIKANEYTTTSITFDKRLLVRVETEISSKGYINAITNLSGLNIKNTDRVYVLGIVPNTDNTFVMYSVSGSDISESSNIKLISDGQKFIDGVKSTDYFLKFNDTYYAYVIVKSDTDSSSNDAEITKKGEKNTALGAVVIGLGSVVVLFLGYQIIRLRRRVRAA